MTAATDAKLGPPSGWQKSLLFHAALIASLVAWDWWNNFNRERFGDPNSLGASAGVSAVAQIPIPRRDNRLYQVANDTQSQLQTPDKQQPKPKVEREDPDAIAIAKKQKKTPQELIASNQRYKPDPVLPNQVTSTLGRAASSPLYGVKGSGGVGASENSPFGDRFGWYGKLIQERVGQKWRTDDVASNIRTAPKVLVGFTIQRNGAITNVRVLQSSGIYSLDNSAQRAIYEASPLPPLPDQFERPNAQCEFLFELTR
jgi:periplasmic protein TonB